MSVSKKMTSDQEKQGKMRIMFSGCYRVVSAHDLHQCRSKECRPILGFSTWSTQILDGIPGYGGRHDQPWYGTRKAYGHLHFHTARLEKRLE